MISISFLNIFDTAADDDTQLVPDDYGETTVGDIQVGGRFKSLEPDDLGQVYTVVKHNHFNSGWGTVFNSPCSSVVDESGEIWSTPAHFRAIAL